MIMSRDEEDCKSPIRRSILENVRFTVLRVLGGAGPGVTSGGGGCLEITPMCSTALKQNPKMFPAIE